MVDDYSEQNIRIQKDKHIESILRYVEMYNDNNVGAISMSVKFDSGYNNMAIAWHGEYEGIEICEISQFFVQLTIGGEDD